ncbi:MAG: tRNA (guanosine(46)-N7)-methyltransferase TrmB [Aestuariibacter sp.]
MSKYKTQEEAEAAGVYVRKVQSFVKREGRLTKGQAASLEKYWPTMGIDYQPEAISLTEEFGNDAPVVLEIGFGMGHSLIDMATNEQDKNFIGIEVHTPGVGAVLAAAAEAGLNNLKVMDHDAVEVLKNTIPDNSLSRVQLYFPDPWHKKRHHKRRIVQPEFVQLLRQKLKVDGLFHMATDWENYAEHMLEVMQSQEGYENTSDNNQYVPRPDFRPLTKFEQRGHRLGHGVWDLIYRKIN